MSMTLFAALVTQTQACTYMGVDHRNGTYVKYIYVFGSGSATVITPTPPNTVYYEHPWFGFIHSGTLSKTSSYTTNVTSTVAPPNFMYEFNLVVTIEKGNMHTLYTGLIKNSACTAPFTPTNTLNVD